MRRRRGRDLPPWPPHWRALLADAALALADEAEAFEDIGAAFDIAGDEIAEAAELVRMHLDEAAQEARAGDFDAAELSIEAAALGVENARAAMLRARHFPDDPPSSRRKLQQDGPAPRGPHLVDPEG